MDVCGNAGAGDVALVHPQVEAGRPESLAQRLHRQGRHPPHLNPLLVRQVRVERDVAVRAHQNVAGIVGVEIEKGEALAAPGDDEGLRVVQRRRDAKGALSRFIGLGGA